MAVNVGCGEYQLSAHVESSKHFLTGKGCLSRIYYALTINHNLQLTLRMLFAPTYVVPKHYLGLKFFLFFDIINAEKQGDCMSITIKLSNIIDELEMMSSEMQSYLNIKTGEIVTISDYLGSEEDADNIEKNPDDFVLLPTQFDINEYSIMENYIDEIDDEEIKCKLYESIRGKGAFRRFKNTIYYLNLKNQWYDFKAKAFKKIATEWCEENDINYE